MSIYFTHETFISPMSWRYGGKEMRQLWSEMTKRKLMRQVWLALATAQHRAGIVTGDQLADLQAHAHQIDIERSWQIEQETRHDVMAEIRCYAEQCPIGGGVLHLGATSADITDNVDALRLQTSLRLVVRQLGKLLELLAEKIEENAGTPIMAYTHIQPAEPTTLGYRFAVYAQDLAADYEQLHHLLTTLKGKGFKGAVGSQASYVQLLAGTTISPTQMEADAMCILGIEAFSIATQTYTRQQDLAVQMALAGLASSLHKFALDFRLLQSPAFGEWAEPFGTKQVGSSAMPFKRNPINMENVCSLARFVAGTVQIAWDNASQAILERSLDDSANRRLFQPESFLAMDEMLQRMIHVVRNMHLDQEAMRRNLANYAPFAATERLLMALVHAGANRQEAHDWLREHSLNAWAMVQQGQPNPLVDWLVVDPRLIHYLLPAQIRALMLAELQTGTAPERAKQMAQMLRQRLVAQ